MIKSGKASVRNKQDELSNYNIKFREFICNPAFLTFDFLVAFRAIDESPDMLLVNDVVLTINEKSFLIDAIHYSIESEFGFIRIIAPVNQTGPVCDVEFDWTLSGKYTVVKNGTKRMTSKFTKQGCYKP